MLTIAFERSQIGGVATIRPDEKNRKAFTGSNLPEPDSRTFAGEKGFHNSNQTLAEQPANAYFWLFYFPSVSSQTSPVMRPRA
jgi:hypothetical protein